MDLSSYKLNPEVELTAKMSYAQDQAGLKFGIYEEDIMNNGELVRTP